MQQACRIMLRAVPGRGGERLIGQIAKHQQVANPINTVFSIKRFMGWWQAG